MRLISVSGPAGAGKSTVAKIAESRGYVTVSLADPIKRAVKEIWDFSDRQLWGPSEARNEIDPRCGRSPREILQHFGTEHARYMHPDVWIRYAMRVIKRLEEGDCYYVPQVGLITNFLTPPPSGVIIPDVRYPNELEAVRSMGGECWWKDPASASHQLQGATAQHPSENSIVRSDCDLWVPGELYLVNVEKFVLRLL